MHDERVILTEEQALAMLPEGDQIHTFRDGGIALLGADWNRADLEQAIRVNKCEVGGK